MFFLKISSRAKHVFRGVLIILLLMIRQVKKFLFMRPLSNEVSGLRKDLNNYTWPPCPFFIKIIVRSCPWPWRMTPAVDFAKSNVWLSSYHQLAMIFCYQLIRNKLGFVERWTWHCHKSGGGVALQVHHSRQYQRATKIEWRIFSWKAWIF